MFDAATNKVAIIFDRSNPVGRGPSKLSADLSSLLSRRTRHREGESLNPVIRWNEFTSRRFDFRC